ncbi:MAG: ABC transporter substrate-binding protein [Alcanivorax sp.]|nr:ABC transporter substrate-binding protein [Alcanivorax sp.]
MQMQQIGRWVMALWLMAMTALVHAENDPRQVVMDAVNRMTQRIDANRDALKKDPEKARQLVREELVGLVDFKRITRMVMGDYFNQASRDQKYHFLDVFKNSLIDTYASGVTLYEGQKIKTLPMQKGDRRGDYARVRMEMTTNTGKVVPIFYTLHLNDDQWQVINVYVNGLDLRDTYRAQFQQGMQQYNNDIDQVIAHWSADANIDTGIKDKDSPAPKGDKTTVDDGGHAQS